MSAENKKSILPFFLLLALLIGGYFFFIKSKSGQNPTPAAANNNPTEVTVVTAQKQSIQLFKELPGRVTAAKFSDIRPQVDGIIKKITFTEGTFVEEGQPLYQIDPTVYNITYENVNATLKAARAKKDRYQVLVTIDAVSKQEYDDAKAAFKQAESAVQMAKTNLNYTKVLAPISGYIGKSNVTPGKLVTTNQAEVLTTITALDPIYVDMSEPSKDATKPEDQSELPVSLVAQNLTYNNIGVLKFSEVFADETTDSVRLRALFPNEEKKLIPGMFVTGQIHLAPFEAILVPQRAASRAPDGSLIVFLVDKDNIVKAKPIKATQSYKDNWIVQEGINEGDVIIYEGFQKVADGAKVKPTLLKVEEEK